MLDTIISYTNGKSKYEPRQRSTFHLFDNGLWIVPILCVSGIYYLWNGKKYRRQRPDEISLIKKRSFPRRTMMMGFLLVICVCTLPVSAYYICRCQPLSPTKKRQPPEETIYLYPDHFPRRPRERY